MNLFSQDQRFARTPNQQPEQRMGIGNFMKEQIGQPQRGISRPPVPQPGAQGMKFIMDTGMQRAREQKMQEMKQKMMGQMQSQVQESGAARTPNQQDPRMMQFQQMFQRFQQRPVMPQGFDVRDAMMRRGMPAPQQSFNPQSYNPWMGSQVSQYMQRQPFNPAGQGAFGVMGGPEFNLWRGR